MNWGAKMLIFMLALHAMAFIGFTILPMQISGEGWQVSDEAYSFAINDSVAFASLGMFFDTEFNSTENKTWGQPSSGFQDMIAQGNVSAMGFSLEGVAAFLGAAGNSVTTVLSYGGAFVAILGNFISGPFILFYTLGIPQPILGLVSILWSMLFFVAIFSLVTGRWQ